ncbi:S-layer homology domain-containing protein [Paenibacillus sp. UNC451MF]|uniref:S-layer homology domain-containing protein n=1 Tax=Paenibacillus sp. UNC451MF TaxID=1449063 RepID=UPI00048B0A6C|nr:S-layer homology domain-containing protein [Paenibacillus sp. UNC451MF]
MYSNRCWNVRLRSFIAQALAFLLMVGLVHLSPSTAAADSASPRATVTGTVYVQETAVPADGSSQTIVSALLKDGNGSDLSIAPERIKFHTSLGSLDSQVTASVYGQYSSVLRAPVTSGVAYISAEVDGIVIPDMARVNFTAGAVSASRTVIVAEHQTLPADGSSQTVISVFLKDNHGNDIADRADSLQLSTTLGQLSSVTYVTYGRYETTLVSPLYGTLGHITPNPESASPLEVSLDKGAIPANAPNQSPIPVTLSATYENHGYYKAILKAPLSSGIAQINGVLNGTPIASGATIIFTGESTQNILTQLSFDQASYSIRRGQGQNTVLEATYSNGSVIQVSPYAKYTLSDPSIASVDSAGKIQGLQGGQTVLTATYGGLTASTKINVIASSSGGSSGSGGGSHSTPSVPDTPSGLQIGIITTDGLNKQQALTTEDIQKGTIVIQTSSEGGQVNISATILKQIQQLNPQAVLIIKAGSATMQLPIAELDLKAISTKYGFPEASVNLQIGIHKPDPQTIQTIEALGKTLNARLLTEPMEFEVQVTGENHQNVFITTFNRFIERSLSIGNTKPPETATGVWWVPESNQFRFVPTHFDSKEGQWSAVMKRQGTSIYTVLDRPVSFEDLNHHWSEQLVEQLASKLIIQGRSDQAFDPDSSITRAEMAALVVRALGLNESKEASPFADTNGGWYETAVATAYKAGLIAGYDDGTFRPMQSITREELAGLLVKAMNFTKASTTGERFIQQTFTDEAAISSWALSDVRTAMQLGIVEGNEQGEFKPGSYTSRAEATTMLGRMLKLIEFM